MSTAGERGPTPDPTAPASGPTERPTEHRPERQAAMIEALVSGGPAPAGVDPERLDKARRALLARRAAEAAAQWPLLAGSLGEEWIDVFARQRAGGEPVGGLREGWDLARTLAERGELSGEATVELIQREAEWHYDGHNPPKRRVIWLHRALPRRTR